MASEAFRNRRSAEGSPATVMRELTIPECRSKLVEIQENLERVIEGKTECLEILVTALASGGSVLMEDVPGVGKTTLAKSLAKSIRAKYSRIQFTPDLLPADILGSSIYKPSDGTFEFKEGPVFANVILADEINRASPRTQSALLEAMSEQQATIEGTTYKLPAPFLVLATQNPTDFHGTYPLPEAQLDRFLVLLKLGYPSPDAMKSILFARASVDPFDTLEPIVDCDDVLAIQAAVRSVHVEDPVADYIVGIVDATRQDERLKLGVSPRGALMLFRASQGSALQQGREFVVPDDVRRMSPYVLPHRILLTSKSKYSGVKKEGIITEVLDRVPVPT